MPARETHRFFFYWVGGLCGVGGGGGLGLLVGVVVQLGFYLTI